MDLPSSPAFLAIVGATASGKTALSLEVGRAMGGEVISMDSRQIYRGMDIGTGKVSLRERALIPHHGLDLRDPDERYSAGQFARDARKWIREIRGRGRLPLVVGGTGFFLRALMEPLFSEPAMDPERLRSLRNHLNGLSLEGLARYVEALDPERATLAREGGRHRMTRTVEVALLTGKGLSQWHRDGEAEEPPLPGRVFLLHVPREILRERIRRRVREMLAEGLEAEVRLLLHAGYGRRDPGMTGAGYREMVEFLEGRTTLEEAEEGIQRSHRQYARRQVTWFRNQLPKGAVLVDGTASLKSQLRNVCSQWEARGGAQG